LKSLAAGPRAVATEAPAGGAHPTTPDVVPTSQLQLVNDQLRRSPFVVAVIDIFLAWLLLRAGISPWIFAWVVFSGLMQIGRVVHVQRIAQRSVHPTARDLNQVYGWFFVLGVIRAWPVVLGFSVDNSEVHFLVTLVTIGSAAGGLGTAAGLVKAYAAWVVPLGLVQVGAWLLHNDFEGRWIAGLMTLLLTLLVLNVRSYGLTLQQLGQEVARAEAERRRADDERQRAEVAVLAKTRFFAAASHDLRQPLGVLRWYGDAVRLHADQLGHEPLQAIGEGIGRALEHAEPLVRKYLDIAKIEAGAFELSARALPLAPLFRQVRDGFAHEAELHDLQVDLQLGLHPETLAVYTDEGVLRSILDNLVGNAVKFTPPGGRITLRATPLDTDRGPLVRLAVRDTGIGIAQAEQARVFEDFYQVDNPERSRSKGMGLGLAIVRRQATLLGSSIRLASASGRGATFELDLPAARTTGGGPGGGPGGSSDGTADGTAAPLASSAWAQSSKGPVHVLVIDDEPDIRQALRLMMEATHWQASTAAGLVEARQVLASGVCIDAIVVDYRLQHDETGIEVVHALRADGCRAPALVLTGDTSPDKLRLLAETGLPVLHKPVAGELLVATIVELLSQEAAP
jgi:signal transduction histidine kinase/CheY-like chemotaxis protein